MLTAEFWLTLVKYALVKDALCFRDNIIDNTIKKQIFDVIKKNCGKGAVNACQKIIEINDALTHNQQHQRSVQCIRIQKAGLLPEPLIAELQNCDWPTGGVIDRTVNAFAVLQFSPGTNINTDFQTNRGGIDLGLVIFELKSPELLKMLIAAGFKDQHHTHGKTSLEYLCEKNHAAMVKILLTDDRYQNYQFELIHKLLITALREHRVKLVEVFLQLPLDYLQGHNLLVWPMENLAHQILAKKSFEVRISAKELRHKKAILKLLLNYRNPQGQGFSLDIPDEPFNIFIICAFAQQIELLEVILGNTTAEEIKRVINQTSAEMGNQTALGIAAALNHFPMVFQLLNAGADPNLPSDDLTSHPLALTNSFHIRLLLQQRGAKPNVFNQWHDFDLQGKVVQLRPLTAEALFGTVESLQRVIDTNDFGSVDIMAGDAAAPILYALGRLFGLIPETKFQQTGDSRSTNEIVADCMAKFNLLVANGAQVNGPLINNTSFTLLDLAIITNSADFIRELAQHRPKSSAEINEYLQVICMEACQSRKKSKLIDVLVELTLLPLETFYLTIGGLIMIKENNNYLSFFLENIDNYNFEQQHQNFIWNTLWQLFNNDKDNGRQRFYSALNLLLWLTAILPPIENFLPNEQNKKLLNVFTKMVTGRYEQTQKSKQTIAAMLDTLNEKLQLKSTWTFKGHTFSCRASNKQAETILKFIPSAYHIDNEGKVSVKIKDPEFKLNLPEKNLPTLTEKTISSRNFLIEQGYTPDEIAALRRPTENIEASTPEKAEHTEITWFGGKISSSDRHIIHLENSNHFLFIDQKAMLKSGCTEQDLKKLSQVRLFSDSDKRCVAPLKGKLNDQPAQVQLCDQLLTVHLKGEIRDADIEARLLCGPALECDQKGAQLFVAVTSVPSMHTEANIDQVLQRIQAKVIELDYEQSKADATPQQEFNPLK